MRIRLAALLLALSTGVAVPALAADHVNFQFSWLPGGDRAAYYLAQSEGLFEAEGLDVDLVSGRGSSDSITKVATGAADMGEGGLDALFTAKVGTEVPVVAVMPVYTKAPDSLVTTAASGITGLKDVAGRKVATSPFTSSNGPWPFLLQANGVDPESVELIKADASTLPAMLAAGRVDAIIQYVTSAPQTVDLLESTGATPAIVPWAEYGLDGYSSTVFVSEAFLAEHRDVVLRFVRALVKAERLMQDDPALAAAAVKAAIPEIELDMTRKQVDATVPLLFNANTDVAGLGIFDPDRVRTTWEWVARQQGVDPASMDPMASVDLGIGKGE
ncbi:ABC transporter substrate-binding protein [Zavarzinia compransoris]|uniref:ABC transporter substrate-binding protein n=1 Tax=Zavarzinia marina TaxID=2911065 RepID=UPI001F22EA7E|nr:ABC transporter substrate-binding protein [Zavarzinia marina]MCF4165320.1 ABC transporter substrate-binding protein [Zavarzinia marina]